MEFNNYVGSFSNKSLSKSKGDLLGTWVSMSLEEINKNMYDVCLDNLKIKVLPKEVFNDKQTSFQIINMMESITMDNLENLVSDITDVDKKGVVVLKINY